MNSEWIKKDKPIRHNYNAWFHGICWIICAAFTWQIHWLVWIIPIPKIIVVLPFIGKTFFDLSLNIFRKKPLGYLSFWGDNSKLDELEYEVFDGNGLLAKGTYSLIILIFNMFYFYAK
jgi:hypothetical protein